MAILFAEFAPVACCVPLNCFKHVGGIDFGLCGWCDQKLAKFKFDVQDVASNGGSDQCPSPRTEVSPGHDER